jgi:hypothetical protein
MKVISLEYNRRGKIIQLYFIKQNGIVYALSPRRIKPITKRKQYVSSSNSHNLGSIINPNPYHSEVKTGS